MFNIENHKNKNFNQFVVQNNDDDDDDDDDDKVRR